MEYLQNERHVIFFNVIQKIRRDLNKINNSPLLEVSIVTFRAHI